MERGSHSESEPLANSGIFIFKFYICMILNSDTNLYKICDKFCYTNLNKICIQICMIKDKICIQFYMQFL